MKNSIKFFVFIIVAVLALTSCGVETPKQVAPLAEQNEPMAQEALQAEETQEEPALQEAPQAEETQEEPALQKEPQAETKGESAPIAPSMPQEEPSYPVVEVARPWRALEEEAIRLVNLEREKAGLSPLTPYDAHYDCALLRVEECVEFWSHTRPDGTKWHTVYAEHLGQERIRKVGENLGKNFKTVEQVTEGFMGSETHRNTMLDPDYTHISIAIILVREETESSPALYAITQHFYQKEET